MPCQSYVAHLPDGRYFAVELPDGSTEVDSLTGDLILQPAALRVLDRFRVLFSPLPATATANRLRLLRECLGLSREAFAAQLKEADTLIAEWEAGSARPTVEQLAALEQLRQRAARTGFLLPDKLLAS